MVWKKMTIINTLGSLTNWLYSPFDRWWDFFAGWGFRLQELVTGFFSGKISSTAALGLCIVSLVIWGVLLFLGICIYADFTSDVIAKTVPVSKERAWVGYPMINMIILAVPGVIGWFLSIFEVRLLTAFGVMVQLYGIFMFLLAIFISAKRALKSKKRKKKIKGLSMQHFLTCTLLLFLGCILFTSIFAFLAGAYVYVTIAIAFAWMVISMIGGVFEGGGAGGGGAAAKTDSWTPKDLPANISINGENYGLGKSYSWGAEYTSSSGNSVTITNVYSMGNGEASTNAGHVTYHK